MAKTIRCADLGLDCDYEAMADDQKELMELVRDHARRSHDIETVSEELAEKIRNAMRDV